MVMTNYMELLAANSPWNLISYMALPMILAEAVVATEFFAVYYGERADKSRKWNRALGIITGIYYTLAVLSIAIFVLPHIQFRGWIDVAAILSLFLGVIPIFGLFLTEIGVLGKSLTRAQSTIRRFILLIAFLVFSHSAMIFGMMDPTLSGWQPEPAQMMMHHDMSGMQHDEMPPMQHQH